MDKVVESCIYRNLSNAALTNDPTKLFTEVSILWSSEIKNCYTAKDNSMFAEYFEIVGLVIHALGVSTLRIKLRSSNPVLDIKAITELDKILYFFIILE